MPQRTTTWSSQALVVLCGCLAFAAAGCGKDAPNGNHAPTPGPSPSAVDDALRSPDPTVAGPAAFAEFRRFADSGDVSILMRLVPPARAKAMRDELEGELERFRKDPERARAAQERMALPKSPAEMSLEEFTRELGASVKRSGAARAQVDQEAGTRYLSTVIERSDTVDGRCLVVRGEATDAAGATTTRESVFVWTDGRWAFDMDASHDRNQGLVRRVRLPGPSPNAFAFAGDAILVSSEGLRRHPLDPEGTVTSAPDTAWVGAICVGGDHVFHHVEGAWRDATLPALTPSPATFPEGVHHVAVAPSRAEAYLATGTAILRMNLVDGTTSTAFALPEDGGGVMTLDALPNDRVLVRPRGSVALEARALADGARAFAIPLPEAPEHEALVVSVGGDVIAVADGSVVNLYAATDGTFLRKLTADGRVETVAVSPDGRLLALDTSRVHVHRVADGVEVRVLSAQPGSVTPPLAWDATGRRLAAWLREGGRDGPEASSVGLYRFD
jgi:hypothetical protein